MSSTTSSDCESCDCSQCTYSFEYNHNDYGKLMENSHPVPIYAAMAHPLIYYARVQPVNKKLNDQPRRENPFKKAFRWYTQERCRAFSNNNDVNPEKSGFANWLDNKYVEYLRESGQQTKLAPPTSQDARTPKYSTDEPFRDPCAGTTNPCGRYKSLWRKRRRSGNDSGDVIEKCPAGGSCEFILKPKDLTRAASENCYHSPTSNATVASSNMPCNTKCSGRSQSLSDLGREKSVPKHSDPVPHIAQGTKPQEQIQTKLLPLVCTCPLEKLVQVPSKEQRPMNEPKPPQENVPKVVQVPSKDQYPTKQPSLPLQDKVPEAEQIPPKNQVSINQSGPCCKCHLKKVPEIVQVPSQSRAEEESCQYPEVKVVPINKETQCEPESEPPHSTQNPRPCCCNACKALIPPPPPPPPLPPPLPLFSKSVKVQSCKISTPQIYLAITPSAQNDTPKKQKKAKQLSVSCQRGEGNKSKVDTQCQNQCDLNVNKGQSQHQQEPCVCRKYTAPSLSNCREVNQVFGPIPIRRQSYSTVAMNEETGEYSVMKEVAVVNKFTRSVTCAANDAAQTSDHSIHFENDGDGRYQYPLFFKVIYGDLFKKE